MSAGVVRVAETGTGRYTNDIRSGDHLWRADEPESLGGADNGPAPYELLASSLGACTSITLRMYADRKGWALDKVSVEVRHEKIHAEDCAECETKEGRIDRLRINITLEGRLDDEQRARLLEIARKCPVHRTLQSEIDMPTRLSTAADDA